MTVELTEEDEEDMRQALFGASHAPAPQVTIHDPMAHIPDVVIVASVPARKKKPSKAFTPRMRVTLQVGNVFEGATQAYVHEADTISRLLAEQESVKAARKKYRYVEVVSVKAIG
ncbi:hypothetical protein SFA35_25065 (plasmid) [Pseudomonas sp. HR96]|uniref:hypothetical protein n=1 Tax=Pseudomonas sp. HR96 TaxID=1027966 RepID=UPI002A756D1B|nr:hypothetical protein [Pseudomonas sp. HR96]WPP02442.1 hypothetical protein SFA35_25065 [Pseudomonas sp. HR96]